MNASDRTNARPSWIGKICIGMIRLYQMTLSPIIGRSCRFHPTCSSYAIEAFEQHSPLYAFYLTAKRILSCHPFHPGGFDPVPQPKQANSPNPHKKPHK